MKIKSVKLARSIWLFDLQDLNPSGKDLTQDLFDFIKDAYGFVVAPDLNALLVASKSNQTGADNSPAIVFERGHFQTREEVFIEIAKLAIHNDGIVVDTPSSTADADRFAQDLLQSATREFSLAYDDEETVRKRIYVSELIVHSELSWDAINPRLAAFASRVSESLSEGTNPQFRIGGLQFWTAPNDAGKHRLFTLERQAGKAFAEHRYFSQAPLQTDKHFKLLQELEQVVMGS